jgi:hypothetical protein
VWACEKLTESFAGGTKAVTVEPTNFKLPPFWFGLPLLPSPLTTPTVRRCISARALTLSPPELPPELPPDLSPELPSPPEDALPVFPLPTRSDARVNPPRALPNPKLAVLELF